MDKQSSYLDILKTTTEDEESPMRRSEAADVLWAARMGSQTAYDAIVEFYVREHSEKYNTDNYPLIAPSVAMLAATDKPSKFANSEVFSKALTRFISKNSLSEVYGMDWTHLDWEWIDSSFLKKYEGYIAPQLPRLIFKNSENEGFDELVTKYESEYSSPTPLSLILYMGMSDLSRTKVNERDIYEPDNFLKPLMFYEISNDRIKEVIEEADKGLAKTQISEWELSIEKYFGRPTPEENYDALVEEMKDEILSGILKSFWQISIINQILQTSLDCAENRGYGGERHIFGWMHLYFDIQFLPVKLTYVGKHILGSLIATVEVLKQLLEMFEIDEDTPLKMDVVDSVDRVFKFSLRERISDRLYIFHKDIETSVNLGQELIEKFPELENYVCKYRNRSRGTAIPFFDVKKWDEA